MAENITIVDNPVIPNILELRNIKMEYPGGVVVIDGFNLLLEHLPEEGDTVAILGPSGCGKSTILRMVCGLTKPTSGEIFMYGKPKTNESLAGMIFQQYSPFPFMTVLDNVAYPLRLKGVPKKERREQAMEMLKICDLEKHAQKYAQYPLLSGGQLQRVAIARSLMANQHILLMDEPFGALDITTRQKMQDKILAIQKQLRPTIVLVTHDIREAVRLSSHVYVMQANPGRIILDFPIPLGPDRSKLIVRDQKFNECVWYLEDVMDTLST